MRIAVVNWTRRAVGGAETTMAAEIEHMAKDGHDLALWYEIEGPEDRPVVPFTYGPSWCVEELGRARALAALKDWAPEVLLVHGLLYPATERDLLNAAPAVFFVHGYYGTCISGNKTLTVPRVRPCPHPFGWKCLLRYYPRRTGGLNPLTMIRDYRRQAQRLSLLRRYRFLLVDSAHMRSEYLKHGFAANRVITLPFPPVLSHTVPSARRSPKPGDPWRLLFVGRMDRLKGGLELLRASVQVAAAIPEPLVLTMVGDGPSAREWRDLAQQLEACTPKLTVRFPGWVAREHLGQFYEASDLLVMPSLWPEPFGLTGLEAAPYGLPCVGFAVGGIPDWLTDGANGHLASADPPSVSGLTAAILLALHDPAHYHALRRGAIESARRIDAGRHMAALLDVLRRASGGRGN